MNTIYFEVATPGAAQAELIAAAKAGKPAAHARLTFPSAVAMARILTPTRWALVQLLTGAGPVGIRELARRANRDVKGVHTDAVALVQAGVIDRTPDGRYSFPFDRINVQFQLDKAA